MFEVGVAVGRRRRLLALVLLRLIVVDFAFAFDGAELKFEPPRVRTGREGR